MTRRTAKTRLEHSAPVDAGHPSRTPAKAASSSQFQESPTLPHPRQRKPRPATPQDQLMDDTAASGEWPTAPRTRLRAKAQARARAGADESSRSSPQRSSSRAQTVDADPSEPRTDSLVVPVVTLPQGDSPSTSHSGLIPERRALVPVHSITRKESALVTRQSQKVPGLGQTRTTKAVTVVSPGGRETVVLPAPKRPLAAAMQPVFAPTRPRGRRRSLLGTVLVVLATVAVLIGALYSVSPLSPIRSHDAEFAPNAALLALNPENSTPGGPWDTGAGAAAALGFGGGAGPGVSAPGSAGLPVSGTGNDFSNFSASPGAVFISAAPVTPWPPADPFMEVPGHPAFRVSRPSDGYYWWAFGQCTWWAQFTRRDENLTYLGDARDWAWAAADRGYRVGQHAAPNSSVVFHGGAQGAGGAGHVAHVEAVYPGGWFLVSEMNFYWNGGGWGRVDYRFAHEGWGVVFIY